jgi:type VI secretion system protein ImpL
MKKLFSIFRNRWFLSFLGLAAAAVLIWYLGPAVSINRVTPLESPESRQWTIAAVLALWGLNQLRRHWQARRNERQLQEALKQASPDIVQSKSREEVEDLAQKFEESLQKLKNELGGSRFGSRYLYQLPWYIIIGRSRAGKTTSLKTANLNYIQKAQGVGSTQNCDWFFTDEAVLIDTAGRYISQDIYQDVDKAGWHGFLDLLKKYRPRRPINGVLIAVSLGEVLQQNEVERAEHVLAVKTRLQELHERLGIRFPVYLVFTKSDLLAGFVEFFDDLGTHERSQVWGLTLPLYADLHTPVDQVMADFSREFRKLEQCLNKRLLRRLQDERNNQLRDLIYTFPQQFGAVRPVIEQFLHSLCQPNMRKEIPMLRGVYFTSGTQVGTPIDRVMSAIAETFRVNRRLLSEFKTEGKSYFVKQLLQEVIFPEAGLANTNLYLERQRNWLQRLTFIGALLLVGSLSSLWTISYLNNRNYIREVKSDLGELITQSGELRPNQTGALSVLPLLETAANIPGGYAHPDPGLFYTFGLYQGDAVGENASETYKQLLTGALLPRLLIRLEDKLRHNAGNTETLYETLKIYLMLSEPKSGHFDKHLIQSWLQSDWQEHLPRNVSDDQRQMLGKHLTALLASYPETLPFQPDSALIRQAQKQLRAVPLEQRVYAQLKTAGLRQGLPAFNASEEAAPNAVRVFERGSGKYLSEGVPGFYSYEGYHRVFLPSMEDRLDDTIEESWVMGNRDEAAKPENRKHLAGEVRRLYLEDYARQWKAFLNDINIRPLPSADPQQAAEIVKILSDPGNSPLRKLLVAIDRETSLDRPAKEGADPAKPRKDSGFKKLWNKIPGAQTFTKEVGEATGLIEAQAGPNPVDDAFVDLHHLVQNGLDNLIHGLDDLYRNLDAINNAATDEERSAANKQISQVVVKLRQDANLLPDSVKNKIKGIAEDADNLNKGRIRAYLNDLWMAEVLPFCRQALNDRYPLAEGSEIDITLADFGQFFGPGGIMDTFFQKNLQMLVDLSRNPWRWNDKAGDMSAESLAVFQQAAQIKRAFFTAGPEPILNFELKPINMDAEADQSLLDVGGQEILYRFGPAQPTAMKWPSPDNNVQVRLDFQPPPADGASGFTLEGPWAWLRALDLPATRVIRTRRPEIYHITFGVGSYYVTYELRAMSAFNPFNLKELHKFKCPDRLS